jgi:hypothetical protein
LSSRASAGPADSSRAPRLILGLAFVAFSNSPGTEAKIFATALGGILIDTTIIAIRGRWNWRWAIARGDTHAIWRLASAS